MIRSGALLCCLFVVSLAAGEPAIPDFSEGMPDAILLHRESTSAGETFHLKTALGSKEFSGRLHGFLGEGWKARKLDEEAMIVAAGKGRMSNAQVSLSVYVNAGLPGVDIRVIHLDHKEETGESSVEISIIRRN